MDGAKELTVRPFIGRERERSALDLWLNDTKAPFTLFSITGLGGIGKTSLMHEMQLMAQKKGALTLWIDSRSCAHTPSSFIDALAGAVAWELGGRVPESPLQPLMQASPDNRVLLCMDNGEELCLLQENWLTEAFLPKLPASGLAIVLATRPALSAVWRLHPAWGGRIVELPLANFTRSEAAEYARATGLSDPEWVGAIARASDGHPMALALSVDLAAKGENLLEAERMLPLSQTISAHVLRELAAPELQPLIDILTLLPYANQEMLSRLSGEEVETKQYRQLSNLSFVRIRAEGLALHDLARSHLQRDFRQREPERLQRLGLSAAELLCRKLQSGDRLARKEVAAQLLQLGKVMFTHSTGYAHLGKDSFTPPIEQIREADGPGLRRILEEWFEYSTDPHQRAAYLGLFDQLLSRFPESFGVLREEDGRPAGFFITVLLHRETGRLLSKYFPDELAECCDETEWNREPEEADTYFALLVAARDDVLGFTREELVGTLILDRLSLLGDGSRAVLVATNNELKKFLQGMGFKLRPTVTRACDVSWARADVLELDLRGDLFGDWILSLFTEGRGPGGEPTHFSQPLAMHTAEMGAFRRTDLSESEVRKMLSRLGEPAGLNEIAKAIGCEGGAGLKGFINSIFEDERYGLSQEDRTILQVTYRQYPGNPTAAASHCGMSRATYYRHLRTAIANFSHVWKTAYLEHILPPGE